MSITIRLTDLSTPQAWILNDASPNNDGIMTALQAAQLAALIAGGGVPSPFTNITTFFNGFAAGGAPATAPGIRKINGSFQMQGIITGQAAGNPGADAIMILPVGFQPSVVSIVSINIAITQSPSTSDFANPNYLFIDRAVAPVRGTPGAVYIGVAIPTSDSGSSLFLDGVIFPLS